MDEHDVTNVITRGYCGRTRCDECDHAGILWKNTLRRVLSRGGIVDEHVVTSVITPGYCGRTRCDECDQAGILWTNTL